MYREVQQDCTPEIEVLYMMFERCETKNRKRSFRQHLKYINFRSRIQLDHPVSVTVTDNSNIKGRGIGVTDHEACGEGDRPLH